MSMKYEMEVQADSDGELFLEFPDELLDAMNWSAGDTLIWILKICTISLVYMIGFKLIVVTKL